MITQPTWLVLTVTGLYSYKISSMDMKDMYFEAVFLLQLPVCFEFFYTTESLFFKVYSNKMGLTKNLFEITHGKDFYDARRSLKKQT